MPRARMFRLLQWGRRRVDFRLYRRWLSDRVHACSESDGSSARQILVEGGGKSVSLRF